ncbi:ATP-binding protein [Streptomyces sp. NPDC053741]|jgi:anti-sigma regulatory factor (Ser/Thr protein kinase)|uniref:ATP-binding protein n=1 Tax=Streptomyces TaxID=1883 RepID=UPI0026E0844C|nr:MULTISPECIES: ATP-binding protein [Streptomyces]WKV78046.1 ATP-binding protein [Streptomyces sp. SNU607]WSI17552.1 ATP-binding protein [[Kitasatospora] papulosa]WSZ52556.1 ATP-binding protein [[Kitasatospora] papulosa]
MADSTQRFFKARPGSVGQARTFTTDTLTEWGLLGRAEDIRLCVSELATNALVHGTVADRGFLVRLDADEQVVRLEVHDSRRQHPEVRQAADTDTSGRGLVLVSALADGWGVEDRNPLGKIVWSCFKYAGRTTP